MTPAAKWIFDQIHKRKMTMKGFARASGIDRSTLQRWKYLGDNPTPRMIRRAAQCLQVTVPDRILPEPKPKADTNTADIKLWHWVYTRKPNMGICPRARCEWAKDGVCMMPVCMRPYHLGGATKMIVREGDADGERHIQSVLGDREGLLPDAQAPKKN